MPVHDWAPVDVGLFHDFHQAWTVEIARRLNAGGLPPEYWALLEPADGILPGEPRPMRVLPDKPADLAARGNRVTIRHRLGEVACIIEIVSPGNKSNRAGRRAFVERTHGFLSAGVNVLVVDLLPPGRHDPHGIHKAIWVEVEVTSFELTPDRPLTLAAYVAAGLSTDRALTAYVEPFAVGAVLPDMPAFLGSDRYVPVTLERTYQAAWDTCPADMRYLVEYGRLPDEDPAP